MSEVQLELCYAIIEDLYGDFYARIFSALAHSGRCTIQQIAQKAHLPLRHVKAGIATLIQLRLVFHHTIHDGNTTYNANLENAYNNFRSGKLCQLAKSQHGDLAAKIIEEAVLLGFTTIAELQGCVESKLFTEATKMRNGTTERDRNGVDSSSEIYEMIEMLSESRYLVQVRSAHFQTGFDARSDVQDYMKSTGVLPIVKGRKGQVELDEKIDAEVRKRMSTSIAELGFSAEHFQELKRYPDTIDQPGAKRPKLQNGLSNGTSRQHVTRSNFRAQDLLCVSYGNLLQKCRNNYLADIATELQGAKQSRVLQAALSQIPISTAWTITDTEHSLDLGAIRSVLNKSSEPSAANGHGHGQANGHHNEHKDGEDFTYGDLDRYLAQLGESTFSFLQNGHNKDEWKIDKIELDNFVQRREVLRIMQSRVGTSALRIIRMLLEKGKVDEKGLQEMGLLGAKELRQTMARLKQMGYVDLQEVPREAQRQPNRTIFLWFLDTERVKKVLLESLYKAMVRILQRMKFERRAIASTLEKLDRSDVRDNVEQFMSPAETRVLRRWQRMEQWMLAEVGRLDDSITLLRDI